MSNRGKKFPAEPLADNEVKSLMTACSPRCPTGIRNRALIAILWRAGLRIAESLALEPRDIEHDGTIRVRAGKGRTARTVGIDLQGLALLQVWIERKARLGIGGPIFSTLKGGRMLPAYVRNLMKRVARKGAHRQEGPLPRTAALIRRWPGRRAQGYSRNSDAPRPQEFTDNAGLRKPPAADGRP